MNWNDLFSYRDGTLYRKAQAEKSQSWNTSWAGKSAGAKNRDGYIQIQIGAKLHYAHRIVFEMHFGPIPEGGHIDHINGDKSDNRIENLRLCNRSQNLANRGAQANNTTGFKGVTFNKRAKLYHAQANKAGKGVSFGYFKCPKAAHAAYTEGAEKLWGEFSNDGAR